MSTYIGSSSSTRCVPHEYDAISGVAATTAAASSARPVRVVAGLPSSISVMTRIATDVASVTMRAATELPGTAKKVCGSTRRVIVPPGEWFSKKPVPPLTDGRTLNRYSKRY